ncbi:MAG: Asp-tRNA(Asn)/Glu-tRNA(Gln) amidotransferase subunit GatB [Planctomycetes bacterium]|nr:Asp-tRNA(Asn)/Glu-tRNA(Gln) amidotransferase subunit GatB [Planctomycetota bacterium]
MSDYEPVIGLEVHCQLKTTSKMFCGASTVFGREPNSQVDTVTLGLPGALPVINGHAVELAITAALAVGGDVRHHSKFDRKHYFYPDLPKGYQISQYDEPYCLGGTIHIELEDGTEKVIGLTRIHMEEDAGKLIHQDSGPWSEVDLNRAGVPLIEIVSNPDLRSAAEAYAYLIELKRALKWVGVSDCEMQEGSLRCDANVSVRPKGQQKFGTRVEIKNLNSFRAVESAIEHEIKDQIALYRAGRGAEIKQATKLWDPDQRVTRLMRSKEDAADYRYFPDPDLPPLVIAQDRIDAIRAKMPELPRVREGRFMKGFAFERAIAHELTAEAPIADYFEALVQEGVKPKLAANWTREEAMRLANERHLPLTEAAPIAAMAKLIKLVDAGTVARVVAKAECTELFATKADPESYFTAKGMIQVQDAGQLSAWVKQALAQEPKVVADVQGGKTAAIGRLVGVTMKVAGGKAEPNAVKAEICKQLGIVIP